MGVLALFLGFFTETTMVVIFTSAYACWRVSTCSMLLRSGSLGPHYQSPLPALFCIQKKRKVGVEKEARMRLYL